MQDIVHPIRMRAGPHRDPGCDERTIFPIDNVRIGRGAAGVGFPP